MELVSVVIWVWEAPTNPRVQVIWSIKTNYHVLNFALNSLIMELADQ
jgi:hypothetical protein